jgi:hypothetical protein
MAFHRNYRNFVNAQRIGPPLTHMLIDDDEARKVITKCDYIAELLSPHVVFSELTQRLAMLKSRVAEGLRCAS